MQNISGMKNLDVYIIKAEIFNDDLSEAFYCKHF